MLGLRSKSKSELADIDKQVDQCDNKITVQQAKADQASKLYDESNSTREANAGVIVDLQEQLGPLQDNLTEVKNIFDANKQEMLEKKHEQRSIKSDITNAKATMNGLDTAIQVERTRIENANGPAHAQKVSDLEDARSQLQEHKQTEEQHVAQKAQIDNSLIEAQNEAGKARGRDLEDKRRAVEAAKNMLERLREDQGQQARAFAPQVHNVLRQLKNERGFTKPPVGPMGMHIKLLKPEWGSVIESTCGGQMNAFVVANYEDKMLLTRILKQQNW
jgi:chromosome segregation ATPase